MLCPQGMVVPGLVCSVGTMCNTRGIPLGTGAVSCCERTPPQIPRNFLAPEVGSC